MKLTLFAYNASHYHTNIAVRALRNALFELEAPPEISVIEFSLKDKRDAVLHALYSEKADIYGFSTYIWNVSESLLLAENLKKLLPECKIVFGGPEVSFRADELLEKFPFIDTVISGEGEEAIKKLVLSFPSLPKKLFGESSDRFLSQKPYYFLSDGSPEKIASGKFLYYESSRGCPFSCGYCLSGGKRHVAAKPVEQTLSDLLLFEKIEGGKRTVKLVDRTFNYDLERAKKIWTGLLDEKYTGCYHFEVQPSIIDEETIEILSKAPAGKFQLEAGIQSTNPAVLKECNRSAKIEKELQNLRLLHGIPNVPAHCDLICGLPLEDFSSIRRSVNDVYYVSNELQIGFLKLLHGTKIADSKEKYAIKHKTEPPYEILSNSTLSFDELFRLKGIAHTVDRVANSGKFALALDFLFGENVDSSFVTPFDFFDGLSASVGGSPAAYSQSAMYEKVFAEGLKYLKDEHSRREFARRCREDFRRCERTRMPPILNTEAT